METLIPGLAIINSSATASEMGKTVLDPSILTEPVINHGDRIR